MTRFRVLGATALSLSLVFAAPVLAQQAQNGRPAAHAAVRGHVGGAQMGAGSRAQSNFGPQANVGRANFAARGHTQFVRGNRQMAEGDRGVYGGGEFRDSRGRGFGRDAGFVAGAAAAGLATGAAVAANDYGYGYGYEPYYGGGYAFGPDYYGDSYAYDVGPTVAFDQPPPVAGPMVADASYCAQRFRSYDPASGTYLGFDGVRHPCP